MRLLRLLPVFMVAATAAEAQTPIPARVVKVATATMPSAPTLLSTWAQVYFSGDWQKLQDTIRQDLKELSFPEITGEDKLDLDKRPYSVVFITTLRKKEGEIARVVLQPSAPAPYSTTLPGLRVHYELHVKPVEAESLSTTYFSTATEDPITSQLAAFVKQFDPKILGPIFPAFSTESDTPRSTFYVDLRKVRLPLTRAKIDIEDEAATGADFEAKRESLKSEAAKLTQSLSAREARNIRCATALAEALEKRIADYVTTNTAICLELPQEEAGKLTAWDKLQREIDCAYTATVTGTACSGSAVPNENALLMAVETRYKDLAKGGALKVTGKASYSNVPLSVIGLGVIAGVITAVPGSHDRYKVGGDGKLVLDPLTGGMSIAAVNIHPWRFNSAATSITARERFRFFVGPVLTPEFGLAAGAGVAVIRGLSINAGYGVVRINTLRAGDQAGSPPTDKNRPFSNGTAGFLFFGLGYNFK